MAPHRKDKLTRAMQSLVQLSPALESEILRSSCIARNLCLWWIPIMRPSAHVLVARCSCSRFQSALSSCDKLGGQVLRDKLRGFLRGNSISLGCHHALSVLDGNIVDSLDDRSFDLGNDVLLCRSPKRITLRDERSKLDFGLFLVLRLVLLHLRQIQGVCSLVASRWSNLRRIVPHSVVRSGGGFRLGISCGSLCGSSCPSAGRQGLCRQERFLGLLGALRWQVAHAGHLHANLESLPLHQRLRRVESTSSSQLGVVRGGLGSCCRRSRSRLLLKLCVHLRPLCGQRVLDAHAHGACHHRVHCSVIHNLWVCLHREIWLGLRELVEALSEVFPTGGCRTKQSVNICSGYTSRGCVIAPLVRISRPRSPHSVRCQVSAKNLVDIGSTISVRRRLAQHSSLKYRGRSQHRHQCT
mmetsp:Transcript_42718/g.93204  ORF Transcript_42718/g.93204 Transcript_42718/m.93204 type:complete len:412 (-) Transcript_42718:190-1425(-)